MTAATRQALDRVLRGHHPAAFFPQYEALLDALVAALPVTPTETEARYREVVDRDRHAYLRGAEDGGCAAWITGGWCTRPEDHPMHAAAPREAPTDQRLRDAIFRIAKTQVYENGQKADGISVALVTAIRLAVDAATEGEP